MVRRDGRDEPRPVDDPADATDPRRLPAGARADGPQPVSGRAAEVRPRARVRLSLHLVRRTRAKRALVEAPAAARVLSAGYARRFRPLDERLTTRGL